MNCIGLQPPAADNIPANFDEWIEMHFGPTINKTFFHPYTRKVIEFLSSFLISSILLRYGQWRRRKCLINGSEQELPNFPKRN